jgi:hypothetical protein
MQPEPANKPKKDEEFINKELIASDPTTRIKLR